MKAEYYVAVKYNGYDYDIDTKIENLILKHTVGLDFALWLVKEIIVLLLRLTKKL